MHDTTTVKAALDAVDKIYKLKPGAVFVVCSTEGDGKNPLAGRSDWYAKPVGAEFVKRHVGKGVYNVGVNPASVGALHFDYDGHKNETRRKQTDREGRAVIKEAAAIVGAEPFCVYETLNHAEKGGLAAAFLVREPDTALGKRGSDYRKSANGLLWNGNGSEFDVKCVNGYQIVPLAKLPAYANGLEDALENEKYTEGWPAILDPREGAETDWRDEARRLYEEASGKPDWLRRQAERYLERIPIPKPGGGQHLAAYKHGLAVGRFPWNPYIEDMAIARLQAAGVPETYMAKNYREGFDKGRADPYPEPTFDKAEEAEESEETAAPASGPTKGSDAWALKRFARAHDGGLVYAARRKSWLQWIDGAGWSELDDEEVKGMAAGFSVKLARDLTAAGGYKRRREAALGGASLYGMARNAMMEPTRSDTFDARPAYVGLPDAMLLDAARGERRAAKPEDRVTRRMAVAPEKGAHPRFTKYLDETFRDPAVAKYILRWLGMALTGHTHSETALFFQGPKGTGKSTLIEIVSRLFGTYAKAVPSRTFVKGRFDEHPTLLANLDGPRLVFNHETGEMGRLDDETLCSVISGNPLSARRMGQDFYEFRPQAKVIVCSNFRPGISGRESGLHRRLVIVPFVHEPAKVTEGLWREILREEGAAIAWRLTKEAVDYCRDKLLPTPAALATATEEYRKSDDTIGHFVDACLTVDSKSKELSAEVYGAYRHWCKTERIDKPYAPTVFGRKLTQSFGIEGVKSVSSNGKRWLLSVAINEGCEAPEPETGGLVE